MSKKPGTKRLMPPKKPQAVPSAMCHTRPDVQKRKVLRAHYMARYRVR